MKELYLTCLKSKRLFSAQLVYQEDLAYPKLKIKGRAKRYVDELIKVSNLLKTNDFLSNKHQISRSLAVLNEDFLSLMMKTVIYSKIGNLSKAIDNLKKLYSLPPDLNHLKLYIPNDDREVMLKTLDLLLAQLNSIKELPKEYIDIFYYHLNDRLSLEDKRSLKNIIYKRVNRQKIRYYQQSHQYGQRLDYSLFYLERNFLSSKLLEKDLQQMNFFKRLSKMNCSQAWILKDFFPLGSKHRNSVVEFFETISKTDSLICRQLQFYLLANESFNNFLSIKLKQQMRPVFVEKRKFFQDQLKQGINIDHSIANLIALGDFTPEYIGYLYYR